MKQFSSIALIFLAITAFADTKPKYGPEATVLSQSHAYFSSHPAPDFWALMPYYVPQQDGRSCSVASVAMVMNAIRASSHAKLTADDELVLQDKMLKKVGNEAWQKSVADGGHGVTLDELGAYVEQALKAYGFSNGKVEVVHAKDTSDATLKALRAALVENEKSDHDFIIANFNQGSYTGDAEAGHLAPVGAYDAAKDRVLVLDPDREWYEPYWVSEKTFLAGMATSDVASGKNRGYLHITY